LSFLTGASSSWALGVPQFIRAIEFAAFADPTRGGVSSSLNQIAAQSQLGILIDEQSILMREEVPGADAGLVTMGTLLGTTRILEMLAGDQLLRIC
jgi:hydrogenase maturation factor